MITSGKMEFAFPKRNVQSARKTKLTLLAAQLVLALVKILIRSELLAPSNAFLDVSASLVMSEMMTDIAFQNQNVQVILVRKT